MEAEHDLMREIRDVLVQHSKTYAEWIEHQRKREVELDQDIAASRQDMAASLALQRAQIVFYKRTVLIGIPLAVILTVSAMASLG